MQNYQFESRQLEAITKKVRLELVKLCRSGNSGHLSSCLSCVEILVSLYFSKMERGDKFILSKGHAAPLLYVVLTERGIMPKGRLSTYKRIGGLEEHPLFGEGIEVPTGSLGQGISVANGIALAKRLDKDNGRVYVLLGDGECDEGQIWESAATASKYSLTGVTAIIDRNRVQSDGPTEEVKQKNDLAEKFRAFGWDVIIADGNDFASLERALSTESEKPKAIIANTVRGKGISFIEENPRYYYGTMNSTDYDLAIRELE